MTSFPLNRSALTSKDDANDDAETTEEAPREVADADRRAGVDGMGSSKKDSGAGLKETSFLMLEAVVGGGAAISGGV